MRLVLASLFSLFAIALTATATEEPEHTVLVEDGKIEVRQYEPMIVAEVEVTGDMRRAGNSGFRPLADFIFGNNTAQGEIAMTAPVTRARSQTIEMTAPVTRVKSEADTWTVAFVMPAEWTMETLPRPNNPDVTLREVPGEKLAAIRFSGRASEAKFRRKEAELVAWLIEAGYEITGAPRYAGYDAPYVPGPMRRNEVLVPVR